MNVSAFAVGANDAANSWATSVGAGTVSLGWAYALGSVMETLGATFVSGYVIQNLGKIAVCFLTNNMIKLMTQRLAVIQNMDTRLRRECV